MKSKKLIKFIIISIIFIFAVVLVAEETGYYESKIAKTKTLTEEQIKQFEEDIKNGKDIDVKDYLKESNIDYSNKLTKNVYKTSLELEKVFDKIIKVIFKGISKTVTD